MINTQGIKIIKLVCGDTIVCSLEIDSGYVRAVEPLLLYTVPTSKGTLKQIMIPWMEGATVREFPIPDYHIITSADADDIMKDTYVHYVESRKFSRAEQELEDSNIIIDTSDCIH